MTLCRLVAEQDVRGVFLQTGVALAETAGGSLADKKATPIFLKAGREHKDSNGSPGHVTRTPCAAKSNSTWRRQS